MIAGRAARRSFVGSLLAGAILSLPLPDLAAQEKPAKAVSLLPKDEVVVARVGETPILAGEVLQQMQLLNLPIAKQASDVSWQQARTWVIGRELAMLQLTHLKRNASAEDVAEVLARQERTQKAQGETRSAFLAEMHLDEAAYKRQVTWELSWQKYLAAQRTDKALATFFDKHRAQYDGTSLRLSQIFWKRKEAATAQERQVEQKQIQEVRTEVLAKKMTFAEAAQKFSQSPSGKTGGDIGWITRHEPMPEAIAAAAYALPDGMVSEAISTSLGEHLIVVTERKVGTKTWQDCREELNGAVAAYLLKYLHDQGKKRAEEQGMKVVVEN